MLLLALAACEAEPELPLGRAEDGPPRFRIVSTWEPSIEERDHGSVVDYSFVVRNVGGRAAAPTCPIRLSGDRLSGWSGTPEIGVGNETHVKGEGLLPYGVDPNKVLPRLEPRCVEATGNEPMRGVPKRFFAMAGSEAYFKLTRRGFEVRFGPRVTFPERMNVRGNRTHPEVVLTDLRRDEGTKTVTIVDVDCIGREAAVC